MEYCRIDHHTTCLCLAVGVVLKTVGVVEQRGEQTWMLWGVVEGSGCDLGERCVFGGGVIKSQGGGACRTRR